MVLFKYLCTTPPCVLELRFKLLAFESAIVCKQPGVLARANHSPDPIRYINVGFTPVPMERGVSVGEGLASQEKWRGGISFINQPGHGTVTVSPWGK